MRPNAPSTVDSARPAPSPGDPPNRFYTYGVIARLANVAAAVEVEELVERDTALEVKAANA